MKSKISLIRYAIRRILGTLPIIFGIMLLTFTMTRLMPGNPFLIGICGYPSPLSTTAYLSLVERHKLNDPFLIQFYNYLTNLMGLFWTWLIIVYIGTCIILVIYKVVVYEKIHTVKNPQEISIKYRFRRTISAALIGNIS